MAFHHQHTHGRVFHGHEARELMHMEKRDSHGDKVVLHVPEDDNKMRFIHKKPGFSPVQKGVEVETVYSQVYVTETQAPPTAAATSSTLPSGQAAYASAKSAANSPNIHGVTTTSSTASLNTKPIQRTRSHSAETTTHSSETHTQTTPPRFTRSTADNGIVKGTPLTHTRDPSPTVVKGTPLSASNTSSANLISEKSNGMTTGAKAGLAFGIILAIAACAGLILFCLRRRKKQLNKAGAERLDEKHASTNSFFGGTAAAVGATAGDARGSIQSEKSLRSTRTASTAPRLSLRPVTQFLPNIMVDRKSTGNALDVPAMSEKSGSGWHRTPKGVSQNPFDDAAVVDEKQAGPVSPINPFEEGDGAVVAGAVAKSGKSTPSHSQSNSWEGSEPPTPKSTKFGTAAAVPITAAGAANGTQMPRGPNNVHRVQLDFKPSMDDELGLGAGQLVRMLHEYDDGWCLCMRMDRSQQGVCPRTCLSKLPVKPRPQGPAPQNGPPGRPMGPPPPNMRRPASPAMNSGSMVPRPLTPTGRDRAATLGRNSPAPGPAGRPRSQSMGGATERPVSPVGMPSRKPVPGQAL